MTAELNVCMPTLSLMALAVLHFCRKMRLARVAYGELPRYLRVLRRLRLCPEPRLRRVLGRIYGCVVEQVRHGDGVADYPAINLRAMQAVVPASLALESRVRADPWVKALGRLIGEEPACAYSLQQLAGQIWPHFLHASACEAAPKDECLLIWDASWPVDWVEAALPHLPGGPWRLFAWPRWWCLLGAATHAVEDAVRLLAAWICSASRWLAIPRRNLISSPFRLATELVEPRRLNQGIYDADFLVDGRELRKEEVLLFVTSKQEARLRRKGCDRAAVDRTAAEKGYQLMWLGTLAPSVRLVRTWWMALVTFAWFGSPASPCRRAFADGWKCCREFGPFFERHPAKTVLYLHSPNGDTSWRTDTAIITGLCRGAGARCVGLQTRVLYAVHYEFAFECYDRRLIWGPAWLNGMEQVQRFTGEHVIVGCFYADAHRGHDVPGRSSGQPLSNSVVIFTGDVAGSHYTLDYNVSFLQACLDAAARHPEFEFVVKAKDPEHISLFTARTALAGRLAAAANFHFASRERHDYAALMQGARAVLAIGFTSPGTEALLLGKPALYYTELGGGAEAFAACRKYVAESRAEFLDKFEDVLRPSVDEGSRLSSLDPFRDGQALARVRGHL